MVIGNGFRRVSMLIVHGATILIAARAQAERGLDVLDTTHSSCLGLEWMDPHELLPAGERWMAKETTRILGAANIPSRWDWSRKEDDARLSKAHEHRLRVVLLPSEPSGPGWRLESNTLGATVIDGRSAPPAVYIFYRSVMSLLSRDRRSNGMSDPYFLGPASRALGRVVAHEIAHAIAPGEPHASSGLMQAGLAATFLTAKLEVAIDGHWQKVLGTGLSQLCAASPVLSGPTQLTQR